MQRELEEDSNIPEELIGKVLDLYKLGVKQQSMLGILQVEFKTLERIRNRLIDEGQLTKEGIEAAVQKREKQNEDITCKLLLQGYTRKEIADAIPYSNEGYITDTVVRKLKEQGRITQEQIEQAIDERRKRENEDNEDVNKILEGLREGKSLIQIIETVSFGEKKVRRIRDKLIEERQDNYGRNRNSKKE